MVTEKHRVKPVTKVIWDRYGIDEYTVCETCGEKPEFVIECGCDEPDCFLYDHEGYYVHKNEVDMTLKELVERRPSAEGVMGKI